MQMLRELPVLQRKSRLVWLVLAAAVLLYLPTVFGDRSLFGLALSNGNTLGIGLATINFTLIAVLGALALNLLVGYTGLLSVAHAAFLAIGAFGSAWLGVQIGLPFWIAVLGVGFIGAAIGVIAGLPSARVEGIYLLLSTLGLNALVIFACLKYQFAAFGTAGVMYPIPSILGVEIADDKAWYFLLLAVVAAALLMSRNLLTSREGRAFVALRDHDSAAAASGINVSRAKLKAFAFSSFIVSVAGALNAYYVTNANAEFYNFHLVLGYFAMIVIGGMGSLLGSVLGAMVWFFVPAMITNLSEQVDPATPVVGSLLSQHRDDVAMILFGVVLILVLIRRPAGLAGVWKVFRTSLRRWPYSA